MTVERQLGAALDHCLGCRQHGGYARLVIEMTGVDEAVRSDLDTGVNRNEVPDVEAPANEVVPTLHVFIHPDLDVVPTGWLGIHFFIVRVPRRLQRENGAPVAGMIREDAAARAFGEPARPGADRLQREAAVVLEELHLRAQRVEVGDHCPVRRRDPPLQVRAYGSAAGQLERDPQARELLTDQVHDLVRVPRWAGCPQQADQDLEQIVGVDAWDHYTASVRGGAAAEIPPAVCGNSRSMKRSTVGWGSWFARPGRSFASMSTYSVPSTRGTSRSRPTTGISNALAAAIETSASRGLSLGVTS